MKKSILWFLAFLFIVSPVWAKPSEEKVPKFPKFPKGIWLNTAKPLTNKALNKKVTFFYFWDYTSINCIREIEIMKVWYERYHPHGLEMIWVHAPEFPFGAYRSNVEKAAQRFGISFPMFLDDHFRLWESAKVKAWPSKLLVNGKGEIVFSQAGEGGYLKTERAIQRLLLDQNSEAQLPEMLFKKEPASYSVRKCGGMTSETYFGYKRADWWGAQIANRQYAEKDKEVSFKDRGERVERGFFVQGTWKNQENSFVHARATNEPMDYIGMIYSAHEVYALLESAAKPASVFVTRDDEPVPPDLRGVDLQEDSEGRTFVQVEDPRLYYLISGEDEDDHEIRLWIEAKDVAVYSFSFSNRCLSDFEHV